MTLLCMRYVGLALQSAKLAFAFALHDEDGDERLTRRGLWRYTRSFLTALMALSFASSSLSADELTRAVDDGAVWTSAAIFAETATQTPNRIGFDEFAAWYACVHSSCHVMSCHVMSSVSFRCCVCVCVCVCV